MNAWRLRKIGEVVFIKRPVYETKKVIISLGKKLCEV